MSEQASETSSRSQRDAIAAQIYKEIIAECSLGESPTPSRTSTPPEGGLVQTVPQRVTHQISSAMASVPPPSPNSSPASIGRSRRAPGDHSAEESGNLAAAGFTPSVSGSSEATLVASDFRPFPKDGAAPKAPSFSGESESAKGCWTDSASSSAELGNALSEATAQMQKALNQVSSLQSKLAKSSVSGGFKMAKNPPASIPPLPPPQPNRVKQLAAQFEDPLTPSELLATQRGPPPHLPPPPPSSHVSHHPQREHNNDREDTMTVQFTAFPDPSPDLTPPAGGAKQPPSTAISSGTARHPSLEKPQKAPHTEKEAPVKTPPTNEAEEPSEASVSAKPDEEDRRNRERQKKAAKHRPKETHDAVQHGRHDKAAAPEDKMTRQLQWERALQRAARRQREKRETQELKTEVAALRTKVVALEGHVHAISDVLSERDRFVLPLSPPQLPFFNPSPPPPPPQQSRGDPVWEHGGGTVRYVAPTRHPAHPSPTTPRHTSSIEV